MQLKFALFAVLSFGLPHSMWVLLKFNISPEAVPLGVMNLVLLIAVLLWIIGRAEGKVLKNPFKIYSVFVLVILASIGIAAVLDLQENFMQNLVEAKRQLSLLLLYFLPLSIVKNERDFVKVLSILLIVHLLIGVEVLRSGVLGGAAFNDEKRGSGPFSTGWSGSDIAGSYLAQTLMPFIGIVFVKKIPMWVRAVCALAVALIFLGILATYARGALIGCVIGLIAILSVVGLKGRYWVISSVLVVAGFLALPQSVETRWAATQTAGGEFDESTQGRMYYYSLAWELMKEYPFGVGTGNIREAMKRISQIYVDPHNSFLYSGCEYGILGLGVFIWLLWSLYGGARRLFLDKETSKWYRAYALGMAGMLGAFLGCNLFYANFYKDLVMGTITIHFGLLACACALCANTRQEWKGVGASIN